MLQVPIASIVSSANLQHKIIAWFDRGVIELTIAYEMAFLWSFLNFTLLEVSLNFFHNQASSKKGQNDIFYAQERSLRSFVGKKCGPRISGDLSRLKKLKNYFRVKWNATSAATQGWQQIRSGAVTFDQWQNRLRKPKGLLASGARCLPI